MVRHHQAPSRPKPIVLRHGWSCRPPMPRGVRLMKLAAIDTNLLLALHALLEETSVTRAAKRLGVGQPAMSRSLARLRDHFKDPLLVRKGRQLVLSREAQALAPSVAKAIAAVTDVFEDARGTMAPRSYVVACADLFGAAILPGLVNRLARGADADATLEVRAIL